MIQCNLLSTIASLSQESNGSDLMNYTQFQKMTGDQSPPLDLSPGDRGKNVNIQHPSLYSKTQREQSVNEGKGTETFLPIPSPLCAYKLI